MMTGEGADSDIQADATGAEGNVVKEAHISLDAAEQLADLERDGVYGAVLIGRIADMPNGFPRMPISPTARWPTTGSPITGGLTSIASRPVFTCPSRMFALREELERAAGMGLRPALLPDGIFERPYYMEEWGPLWEAADSLRIPITMHVGGLRQPLVGPGLMAYPGRQDVGWYVQSCGMGESWAG